MATKKEEKKNLEKVETILKRKNLTFRNNLDLINKDNKKVFQLRNCENHANIYVTPKEMEMLKDVTFKQAKVIDHTKKEDGSQVKKGYYAINNVSLDEMTTCIDKVMIAKGLKKGNKK